MTDNELLLAISNMIDQKFKSELTPVKTDLLEVKTGLREVKTDLLEVKTGLREVKTDLLETKKDLLETKNDLQETKNEVHQIKLYLENLIVPRLDTIESCYLDTYNRYQNYTDKMQASFDDIEVMKKVLLEHSEKLQKIS